MKRWYFDAVFMVPKECLIEAETLMEAKEAFKNGEFDVLEDSDSHEELITAYEPDWKNHQ